MPIDLPREHERNEEEEHKQSELKPLLQLVVLVESFDDDDEDHEPVVLDEGHDDPVEDALFACDFEC